MFVKSEPEAERLDSRFNQAQFSEMFQRCSLLLAAQLAIPSCHLYQSIGKSFIFNQWMTLGFLPEYQILIFLSRLGD